MKSKTGSQILFFPFFKLLGKVVHSRTYIFLQNNQLLSETLFGFHKGHSTAHTLQHLADFVNNVFERGDLPMFIFIDVLKAFDTVDFTVLIKRLESLGIRGNYLE